MGRHVSRKGLRLKILGPRNTFPSQAYIVPPHHKQRKDLVGYREVFGVMSSAAATGRSVAMTELRGSLLP